MSERPSGGFWRDLIKSPTAKGLAAAIETSSVVAGASQEAKAEERPAEVNQVAEVSGQVSMEGNKIPSEIAFTKNPDGTRSPLPEVPKRVILTSERISSEDMVDLSPEDLQILIEIDGLEQHLAKANTTEEKTRLLEQRGEKYEKLSPKAKQAIAGVRGESVSKNVVTDQKPVQFEENYAPDAMVAAVKNTGKAMSENAANKYTKKEGTPRP